MTACQTTGCNARATHWRADFRGVKGGHWCEKHSPAEKPAPAVPPVARSIAPAASTPTPQRTVADLRTEVAALRTKYSEESEMFHRHRTVQVEEELEPGIQFARIVRALVNGRGRAWQAIDYAKSIGDHATVRALSASSGAGGGFLVPSQIASDVIPALQPRVAVRRLNPVIVPFVRGRFDWPRVSGTSTATYLGEGQTIAATQPTFGNLALTIRTLAAVVALSNDLFKYATPAADGVLRDELVAAIAAAEDVAFLRGDGTASAPRGLRYLAAAANVIASTVPVSFNSILADLSRAEIALTGANVPMVRPGWIMAPRTEQYLKSLRDASGSRAFPELIRDRRLNGYPVASTTSIPVNLGTGGDESEIILADFSEIAIGEAGLRVDVSGEAGYHDGSTVVSAFSQDQSVIRAVAQHDIGAKHDVAISVLTGVKWGV